MNKEVKNTNKTMIILAWILLIMLISAAAGLTYLKFFGKIEDIEVQNSNVSENKEITSPVIIKALTTIIEEFNKEESIQEFKKNNITVNAELENDSIKVTYKDKETKIYTFKLEVPNLIIDTTSNDQEFKKIFPLIVKANQKRLNNNSNIDDYIQSFLEDNLEIIGLSKKIIEANEIEYIIDISKIIGDSKGETTINTEKDINTNEDNSIEENEIKEGE